MRYHWRAFHFIKYSHNLLWMIYKALPETRCCATVLRMFWSLQFEAKEKCWLYFVLWQFANFRQHYCTKRTTFMQSQWLHCSTSKPDDCWHFRASKLNKVKSLTCYGITSDAYFPYLEALTSTQQTFKTQLCLWLIPDQHFSLNESWQSKNVCWLTGVGA